jgi:uncharacterized protein YutE (UPF0331/DUF86 family)
MISRDVILEKINSIQKCLATILRATGGNPERLEDIIIQDAVVLNLQRATQLCIDIAGYLITYLRWGFPTTLKGSFVVLYHQRVIKHDLAEKMCKMAGFRNIAVHDYKELDIKILKSIVKNHLADFEEYYTAILNYVDTLEKTV